MYLLLQIAYKIALELPLTNLLLSLMFTLRTQNRPSILPCKYLYRASAIHSMTWQSRICTKIFALEKKNWACGIFCTNSIRKRTMNGKSTSAFVSRYCIRWMLPKEPDLLIKLNYTTFQNVGIEWRTVDWGIEKNRNSVTLLIQKNMVPACFGHSLKLTNILKRSIHFWNSCKTFIVNSVVNSRLSTFNSLYNYINIYFWNIYNN